MIFQIFLAIIVALAVIIILLNVKQSLSYKKRLKRIESIFNSGGILEFISIDKNIGLINISKSEGYSIRQDKNIKYIIGNGYAFYLTECDIVDCVENRLLLGTIVL